MISVKRRGNNEGYIAKRKTCAECRKITTSNDNSKLIICRACGAKLPETTTWIGQVTVDSQPDPGQYKRRSFYGKTRKEVFDKMHEVTNDLKHGIYVEPTKTALGDWLDRWLEEYKRNNIEQLTYENYHSIINLHIKPELGKTLISKLKADQIQAFYNKLLKEGRLDGKGGLSTSMVKHTHTIINQALKKAQATGLINRNVAQETEPPKVKNKEAKAFTEEQLQIFIEEAKDDRLYVAFVLSVTTGVRRGELLGLKWDCVNFDNKTIAIKRQLIPHKVGLILKETLKSKKSKRTITLTDDAVRELLAHKECQDQEKKLQAGIGYEDSDLVFAKVDGTFIEPRSFTKRFQRIASRAGLSKTTLHQLRHTHASLLMAQGIHQKVVQERLGHSSVAITMDLYSHLSEKLERQASSSLNGLIKPHGNSDTKTQEEN